MASRAKSPAGIHSVTKRALHTQIDFVLCKRELASHVTNARSYGGTLTSSDHKIVVAFFRCGALYKYWRNRAKPFSSRWDVKSFMASNDLKDKFNAALSKRLDLPPTSLGQIVSSIQEAAKEAEIPKVVPQRVKFNDHTLSVLSTQQKNLRLNIESLLAKFSYDHPEVILLRQKRNSLMREIRHRSFALAREQIDQQVARVEQLKDDDRMFEAVKVLKTAQKTQLKVFDGAGRTVGSKQGQANAVKDHFAAQFFVPSAPAVLPMPPLSSPFSHALAPEEIVEAIKKLKNARACGPDEVPAEFLKTSPASLPTLMAQALNNALSRDTGDPHAIREVARYLGSGLLIPLPKPGKPIGPPSSLRPIMLLNTIRKVISLVVLKRIRPAVEAFISPAQSAFRPGRSTADIVFGKRWLCSIVVRYHVELFFLGLDLSRAFDTVNRGKLLGACKAVANDDEIRMIWLLLADTSLSVAVGPCISELVDTNIGVPQGDGASPTLFTVYLEDSLRLLRPNLPPPTPGPAVLPPMTLFADDVDYCDWSEQHLERCLDITESTFRERDLVINKTKTERIRVFLAPLHICDRCGVEADLGTINCDGCKKWFHLMCEAVANSAEAHMDHFLCAYCRAKQTITDVCPVCCLDASTNVAGCDKCDRWLHMACIPPQFAPDPKSNASWNCHLCSALPRGKEPWRDAKTLGSLYDSDRDADRRIVLAKAAFGRLWKLWLGKKFVSIKTKLRAYNSFVLPVLTYNLGALATNAAIESRLDCCHRRHLRKILNVNAAPLSARPMSNKELYSSTNSIPISVLAFRARWRLFGHVLRMSDDTPAVCAIFAFFECKARLRIGRPGSCLAQTFVADLRNFEMKLSCRADLTNFRAVAVDREAWRRLVGKIERVRMRENEC